MRVSGGLASLGPMALVARPPAGEGRPSVRPVMTNAPVVPGTGAPSAVAVVHAPPLRLYSQPLGFATLGAGGAGGRHRAHGEPDPPRAGEAGGDVGVLGRAGRLGAADDTHRADVAVGLV